MSHQAPRVDAGTSSLEAAATNPAHVHAQAHTHVVPPKVLLGVYVGLMVLTILTVAVTKVDLGQFNIWLALVVAVAKAGLVAMYFMHLRWDSPFNGVILIVALLFVVMFVAAAIIDTGEYKGNYLPPTAGQSMSPGNVR